MSFYKAIYIISLSAGALQFCGQWKSLVRFADFHRRVAEGIQMTKGV